MDSQRESKKIQKYKQYKLHILNLIESKKQKNIYDTFSSTIDEEKEKEEEVRKEEEKREGEEEKEKEKEEKEREREDEEEEEEKRKEIEERQREEKEIEEEKVRKEEEEKEEINENINDDESEKQEYPKYVDKAIQVSLGNRYDKEETIDLLSKMTVNIKSREKEILEKEKKDTYLSKPVFFLEEHVRHKLKVQIEAIQKTSKNKKVVYSVQLGQNNLCFCLNSSTNLTNSTNSKEKDTDYIIIKDRPLYAENHKKKWRIVHFPYIIENEEESFFSRTEIQILSTFYFSCYDYSLFIDTSTLLSEFNISDSIEEFKKLTINNENNKGIENITIPIACMKHMKRNSVYEEGKYLSRYKKTFNMDQLLAQLRHFRLFVFDNAYLPLLSTSVIVREMKNQRVQSLEIDWFNYILKFQQKEHLSLPFLFWKFSWKPVLLYNSKVCVLPSAYRLIQDKPIFFMTHEMDKDKEKEHEYACIRHNLRNMNVMCFILSIKEALDNVMHSKTSYIKNAYIIFIGKHHFELINILKNNKNIVLFEFLNVENQYSYQNHFSFIRVILCAFHSIIVPNKEALNQIESFKKTNNIISETKIIIFPTLPIPNQREYSYLNILGHLDCKI